MFCRKCGEQISVNCEVCPICGENQELTITAEKTGKGGVGEVAVNVLKGTGKAVGAVAGTVVGSIIVPIVSEEVGKGMQKKVKKGTSDFLKAVGIKKKTPLDKAGEAFKALQKKTRK